MPLPRSVARFNKRLPNRIIRPIARYLPILAVVHHTGRVTGKPYAVPVNIFRDGDDIVVPLTYSSNTDWVKNVLAAGRCEIETSGRRLRMAQVRLEIDREKRWAPGVVRFFLNRLGVHEVLRLAENSAGAR